MAVHLRRQIDKLKQLILQLGALVEQAVQNASQAVQDRDVALAESVANGDKAIDDMEIEVEEECLHTLALDQPVAQDLRYVIAVLKINNDLERIGDLAANMAGQVSHMADQPHPETIPLFDLPGMTRTVQSMLKRSLDALVNVDPELAQAVRDSDDEVDEVHRQMFARVEQLIVQNPQQIEQLNRLLSISRQLERMADHAVNIAEDVQYMATGQILRHPGRTPAAAEGDGQ